MLTIRMIHRSTSGRLRRTVLPDIGPEIGSSDSPSAAASSPSWKPRSTNWDENLGALHGKQFDEERRVRFARALAGGFTGAAEALGAMLARAFWFSH
jgi:hypothetical protein